MTGIGHSGAAWALGIWLIAGAPFVTVGGTLPTLRETESSPNLQVKEMIAAAERSESKPEKVGA